MVIGALDVVGAEQHLIRAGSTGGASGFAHSSVHGHFVTRIGKPETHFEYTVSSAVAASSFSLMIMSESDSRDASHSVPVQTPAAPRQSAAARWRPVVMPPAAITGVSPATAATSGTMEKVPIGPVWPAAS